MKIAIFGTGNVGATLGTALVRLGHQVCMGSRAENNDKGLAWVKSVGAGASTGSYATAAKGAELVINATSGAGSIEALMSAGPGALDGRVVIDVSNPLDFSKGAPQLFVANTDSLGEMIQRALPNARVVKALNTMWCGLMVNPGLLPERTVTFVAGNDAPAKEAVSSLLGGFGWRPEEIIDLGDLSGARATEAYLHLWLRMYGATKSAEFNLRFVRQPAK